MHDVTSTEAPQLALSEHGGNLAMARRAFPMAPEPWLDLSTGISPFAYPFPPLPQEAFTRLPDAQAIAQLEARAAAFYSAADPGAVVAAAGSQAIIQWLPRVLPGRRVGILGPTYSEFARSFAAAGAEVTICAELDQLAAYDVAILVNPNNPDGRIVPVEALLLLAAELTKRGGCLAVDEAFADLLCSSASLVPQCPSDGVIILRSLGKTFGLAGLRLGFAITSLRLARALREAIGPWPISGAAIAIGEQAFVDRVWLATTREKLTTATANLDHVLDDAGLTIIGGTLLFRLVRHERAQDVFKQLAEAGILVRPFAHRTDWLRFGIPASFAECSRLKAALRGKALL
jgi:cobalamin biosynthesis protein CobC